MKNYPIVTIGNEKRDINEHFINKELEGTPGPATYIVDKTKFLRRYPNCMYIEILKKSIGKANRNIENLFISGIDTPGPSYYDAVRSYSSCILKKYPACR